MITPETKDPEPSTVAPNNVKRVDDWIDSAVVTIEQIGPAKPDRPPWVPTAPPSEDLLYARVSAQEAKLRCVVADLQAEVDALKAGDDTTGVQVRIQTIIDQINTFIGRGRLTLV